MTETYLQSNRKALSTMRPLYGTVAYAIAGTILVSYIMFLLLSKYGVIPRPIIGDVPQFILLIIMAIFATIGLYADETRR